MKIRDLPAPVKASKADWLPGTSWLGFTPTGSDASALSQCQSTIQRQSSNGYVIEYVTESFQQPNPGFENSSEYLEALRVHERVAGRFIAVHKLRPTSRALSTILGPQEFAKLQDMWAQPGKRFRWSVAFPIVQSFSVVDFPKAKDVLGQEAYKRLYGHSSATLRTLNENERELIADLEIAPAVARNAWIGIEDEIPLAEGSTIDPNVERTIGRDLAALEGEDKERLAKLKRRAMWIAQRFVRERQSIGRLKCDDCGFDPSGPATKFGVPPRGLLDVHHKSPLAEGKRYTTTADFALLCPTCHRIEHTRIRSEKQTNTQA